MDDPWRLPLRGASLGKAMFVDWDWLEPVLDGIDCGQ
jgi:hypothetical protein